MQHTNFSNKNFISKWILDNKLVLMETDTILGIYCKDQSKIYDLKQRPQTKKNVLLVNNINQIGNNLPDKFIAITKRFWPGALTIIYKNVAYRMPNHKDALEILNITGPVYCSSANISGEHFFIDSNEAENKFKNNKISNELLIVDGKSYLNKPSTIYDYDNDQIVRKGPISLSDIRSVFQK